MNTKIPEAKLSRVERLLQNHEKKQKASISLSGEIIRILDLLGGKSRRSALLELAVRDYLYQSLRQVRHERDLRLINASAESTNRNSDDLLDIQSWPE